MQLSRRIVLIKIALWGIGVVAFIAYVFSVAFLLRSMVVKLPTRHEPTAQAKVFTPSVQPVTAPEHGIPQRLLIPSIKVDAAIEAVGIAADGAMDIKKDKDLVAWYHLGPRPGNVGSAVLAGHYGQENGKGAVFNELHTLKAGDRISVRDDKSAATSFIVRESRSYNPAADATAVFQSSDGKAHLNIITCEGTWDNNRQTYSSRLVVFTDKE